MVEQKKAIHAVPSACSRWPPVGRVCDRSNTPMLSSPRNPPEKTLSPWTSFRLTHHVKLRISFWNARARKTRSRFPAGGAPTDMAPTVSSSSSGAHPPGGGPPRRVSSSFSRPGSSFHAEDLHQDPSAVGDFIERWHRDVSHVDRVRFPGGNGNRLHRATPLMIFFLSWKCRKPYAGCGYRSRTSKLFPKFGGGTRSEGVTGFGEIS